jgi:ribosomal protein S18 acetylase RimI-like enzyme
VIDVRPYDPADEAWAAAFLDRRMAGRHQARRDELLDALALPGFVAVVDGEPVGLATYRPLSGEWELFCIAAEHPGNGVGSALVEAVVAAASQAGAARVWLVTTNNNFRALRFYQRRGFRLTRLDAGAVERARLLKPAIPLADGDGVPITDELELARDC